MHAERMPAWNGGPMVERPFKSFETPEMDNSAINLHSVIDFDFFQRA